MAKIKLEENLVAQNIQKIIENLGVSATIEVSRENDTFFVDIESEDSALLIGKHGTNLDSLQFVLAVSLKTQTGEEDFEVIVDVANWRRQREDHLKNMANSIAEKVLQSGEPELLYNLRPSERRVIHMVLAEHPEVISESEGEGPNRYLTIRPK